MFLITTNPKNIMGVSSSPKKDMVFGGLASFSPINTSWLYVTCAGTMLELLDAARAATGTAAAVGTTRCTLVLGGRPAPKTFTAEPEKRISTLYNQLSTKGEQTHLVMYIAHVAINLSLF